MARRRDIDRGDIVRVEWTDTMLHERRNMSQSFKLKNSENTITYGVVLNVSKEFITICGEWSREPNVDSWSPEILPMGMIKKITKLGFEEFVGACEDG